MQLGPEGLQPRLDDGALAVIFDRQFRRSINFRVFSATEGCHLALSQTAVMIPALSLAGLARADYHRQQTWRLRPSFETEQMPLPLTIQDSIYFLT